MKPECSNVMRRWKNTEPNQIKVDFQSQTNVFETVLYYLFISLSWPGIRDLNPENVLLSLGSDSNQRTSHLYIFILLLCHGQSESRNSITYFKHLDFLEGFQALHSRTGFLLPFHMGHIAQHPQIYGDSTMLLQTSSSALLFWPRHSFLQPPVLAPVSKH